MANEITYEPINFKRVANSSASQVHKAKKAKKVELLSDVALGKGNVSNKRKTLRYIRNTVIVASVAITILFRYTVVSDNTADIKQLESEYAQLSEQNINLQCEIDSCTDSDSIEEAAMELGMSQPSKSQKVAVNVHGDDYVEVNRSEVKKTAGTSRFYASMIQTLGNVLEYLY